MFAYVVLCCLLVKFIDCSVVRQKNLSNRAQHLEFNDDIDVVNMQEESDHLRLERSPKYGRETLIFPEENQLMNHRQSSNRLVRAVPMPPAITGTTTETPKKVEVTVDNRHGIRVGMCPSGYVKRGGFCFRDLDY